MYRTGRGTFYELFKTEKRETIKLRRARRKGEILKSIYSNYILLCLETQSSMEHNLDYSCFDDLYEEQ
jgi:hypothetical protein